MRLPPPPVLPRRRPATDPRSGQALAELVVGLVCILILVAALIQLGTLVRADSRNLILARNEAGQNALSHAYLAPVSPAPRYIQNWTPGPDGHAYTRDDQAILGSATLISESIVARAQPAALAALQPDNPVSPLADPAAVLSGFSFVRGHSASGPIPLLPLTRRLIFGRDSISLESEVYLIWTRGIE